MGELRRNRVKHKVREGEVAAAVMGPMSAELADFMGPLGFDGIWFEAEHGDVDYGDIPNLTRACDLWGVTSIVRVNRNVPGIIYRTLDVGAQAVCVPHVNTAAEARAVVQAAKFHPLGVRGITAGRWAFGVDKPLEKANDETLLIILIEDIVAVQNLAEILSVDQIDVFYVAPGDLGQSMGHLDRSHPEVQATVDRALRQIVASGRVAGTLVTDATVNRFLDLGVRFVTTSWTPWLTAGAKGFLAKVR